MSLGRASGESTSFCLYFLYKNGTKIVREYRGTVMTKNSKNKPDGSDLYIEGVHGDGGRLPQGFTGNQTETGGDRATQQLVKVTHHEPTDDTSEAAEEARLANAAGLTGGIA